METLSESLLWVAFTAWAFALARTFTRERGAARGSAWLALGAQAFASVALLARALTTHDFALACIALLWVALTLRAVHVHLQEQDGSARRERNIASFPVPRATGKRPDLRVIRGGAARAPSSRTGTRSRELRPNA